MNDTFELILVVMVIALYYWFAAWSTIKSVSRLWKGMSEFSKAIPFLMAMTAFFGATLWGIIALLYGNGSSDNPAAPFPPIALLSSAFAIVVWSVATAIIYAYYWISSLCEGES